MSKGDKRRPRSISREEEELRWEYAKGELTRAEFRVCLEGLKQQGKITRDGRVLR
jgi:uncharacterized membrane protein